MFATTMKERNHCFFQCTQIVLFVLTSVCSNVVWFYLELLDRRDLSGKAEIKPKHHESLKDKLSMCSAFLLVHRKAT